MGKQGMERTPCAIQDHEVQREEETNQKQTRGLSRAPKACHEGVEIRICLKLRVTLGVEFRQNSKHFLTFETYALNPGFPKPGAFFWAGERNTFKNVDFLIRPWWQNPYALNPGLFFLPECLKPRAFFCTLWDLFGGFWRQFSCHLPTDAVGAGLGRYSAFGWLRWMDRRSMWSDVSKRYESWGTRNDSSGILVALGCYSGIWVRLLHSGGIVVMFWPLGVMLMLFWYSCGIFVFGCSLIVSWWHFVCVLMIFVRSCGILVILFILVVFLHLD